MTNSNSKFGEWQKAHAEIRLMFYELRDVLPEGIGRIDPEEYCSDGAGLYQFRCPSSAQAMPPQSSTSMRTYSIVEGKFDNGHLISGTAKVVEE